MKKKNLRKKILDLILLGLNTLSIIAGILGVAAVIPGEIGAAAVVFYAASEKIRQRLYAIGDKLDDGVINGSFEGDNNNNNDDEKDTDITTDTDSA